MNEEDEIRENIEFCKDIYRYYEKPKEQAHNGTQNRPEYPKKTGTGYVMQNNKASTLIKEHEPIVADTGEMEEESSWKTELFRLVLCLFIAFVVAKLLSMYVIQFSVVQGNSMENTVSEGDYLLVGKVKYRLEGPKRFDVIVLTKDGERDLIKRVIGLPGENVRIEKGNIYIDGEILHENYGLDPMDPEVDPVEIPLAEDEYFVLGDNRLVSLDSRFSSVGAVKRDEILGDAFFRVYPFDKLGIVA